MSAPGLTTSTAVRRTALRVCTPHCGLDTETRLGGEMYEIEVLRELAARGIVFDILLARHRRHPEGVPNWAVHRLPIARGLRWPVAAVVLPPSIRRVYTDVGMFDASSDSASPESCFRARAKNSTFSTSAFIVVPNVRL